MQGSILPRMVGVLLDTVKLSFDTKCSDTFLGPTRGRTGTKM